MSDINDSIVGIVKNRDNETLVDIKLQPDMRVAEAFRNETQVAREVSHAVTERLNGRLGTETSSPERVGSVKISDVFPGL